MPSWWQKPFPFIMHSHTPYEQKYHPHMIFKSPVTSKGLFFLPLPWHSTNTMFFASDSFTDHIYYCLCSHTHPINPSVGVLKREGPHALPGNSKLFPREITLFFGGGGGVYSFHLPLVGWSVSSEDCFRLWSIKHRIWSSTGLHGWQRLFKLYCAPPLHRVP